MRLLILILALVSPIVNAACTASGSINFGKYNPFLSTVTTTSTSINLNCEIPTTVTVGILHGNSGSFINRKMKSGNEILNYNLYSDNGMSTIWGNGTLGTYQYSGTTNGILVTIPLFAKIPSKQNVMPGIYIDNLIINLCKST